MGQPFPSLIVVAVLCWASLCTPALSEGVLGAGSTFVYPVLAKWAEAYEAVTGVTIDYQAVGSGVGIRQIKSRTVDFGASDAPLRPEELAAAGLMQFPIVVGGVVPVVNVEGIGPGQLRLTGSVLADIYLGKITKWNAEAIRDLNPGLALPNQAIIPIHRADGSGTTFILADYLARVSAKWRDEIGVLSRFQPGLEPKAMKELPALQLGSKAPSAMSNTPTRSAASLPPFHCKTGTENSLRQADRGFSLPSQTPIGRPRPRSMRCSLTRAASRPGRSRAQPLRLSTSSSKGGSRQSRC